jgi:hypothetical protein
VMKRLPAWRRRARKAAAAAPCAAHVSARHGP